MDFLKGCRCDSVKVVMGRSLGTPGLSGHMQGSLGPPGPWWVMKRPTRPAEYLRSAPAAGCNFQFSSFVQAMINAGGGQELLQGPSMPQQSSRLVRGIAKNTAVTIKLIVLMSPL